MDREIQEGDEFVQRFRAGSINLNPVAAKVAKTPEKTRTRRSSSDWNTSRLKMRRLDWKRRKTAALPDRVSRPV